jgi:hypothetical protein
VSNDSPGGRRWATRGADRLSGATSVMQPGAAASGRPPGPRSSPTAHLQYQNRCGRRWWPRRERPRSRPDNAVARSLTAERSRRGAVRLLTSGALTGTLALLGTEKIAARCHGSRRCGAGVWCNTGFICGDKATHTCVVGKGTCDAGDNLCAHPADTCNGNPECGCKHNAATFNGDCYAPCPLT